MPAALACMSGIIYPHLCLHIVHRWQNHHVFVQLFEVTCSTHTDLQGVVYIEKVSLIAKRTNVFFLDSGKGNG